MKKLIEFLARIPKDKILHSYVGTLVAIASVNLFDAIGCNFGDTLGFSIMLVCIVGCFKELWDTKHEGTPEWQDAIATIIGGAIGLIVVIGFIL